MLTTPAVSTAEQTMSSPTASRGSDGVTQDFSRPPCRFFLLGKCKFGDSCTFSHQPRGRVPVCSFFEKSGSCRYGKDCKFLHGTPPSVGVSTNGGGERGMGDAGASTAAGMASGGAMAAGAMAAGAAAPTAGRCSAGSLRGGSGVGERDDTLDEGDNCGICLENIPASGKRFGLMNCDHVYCLECLRTWRKSKGPQKDISRTCPECRKVSFFLVPSKEHLKGKEKLKAIQGYKKGLSKLPCKYHKPDGSTICPFGARCFYAHLDESGANVKDRTPPAPPASSRRTCPYLSGGSGRGRRAGGYGGFHEGDPGQGFLSEEDLLFLNVPDMYEGRFPPRDSSYTSVVRRLERLMLYSGEF